MATVLDLLAEFASQVPGLLCCSVVHRREGTDIGAMESPRGFDGAAADAFFSTVLYKNALALHALGMADITEDIITTTDNGTFLCRPINGTDYFWNVGISPQGNVGLTRALMSKIEPGLRQTLP